jgi:hypothetical protein
VLFVATPHRSAPTGIEHYFTVWFGCVRYVDILQFVEVLHGPQSKATLTKVLAMVDPERFSPTSRHIQAVTPSPQVAASAGNARESDEDGSAEGEIRPFGLKGAKHQRVDAQDKAILRWHHGHEFCSTNANV